MGSPISQIESLNPEKVKELACLNILLSAATDACKERTQSRYSSGATDDSLSPTEVFLSKLAQVCDNQRQGTTATSLVCLDGQHGREYILASNLRNSTQLEQTRGFLSELLRCTVKSSLSLARKALHREVLRRILSFNALRLVSYLEVLVKELRNCLAEFEASINQIGTGDRLNVWQLGLILHRFTICRTASFHSAARRSC